MAWSPRCRKYANSWRSSCLAWSGHPSSPSPGGSTSSAESRWLSPATGHDGCVSTPIRPNRRCSTRTPVEYSTDLRRPCTPSRGPTSAVLAHPRRVGSLRSSAPDHDLGHLDDESLADYLTDVL